MRSYTPPERIFAFTVKGKVEYDLRDMQKSWNGGVRVYLGKVMQISKVIEIATEALRRHYFLFMSLSEEGRPDCIGSGTYVLLNSKHYILTAAHVIEELLKIHELNSFIGDTG